jgi:hypothetical protein
MSYYIYNCQVCGKRAKMGKVVNCGGCGIQLCEQCSTFEFCPRCLPQLAPGDKQKALKGRKTFFFVRNATYIYCLVLVGFGILAGNLSNSNPILGYIPIGMLAIFPILICLMIGFSRSYSPNDQIKREIWARAPRNIPFQINPQWNTGQAQSSAPPQSIMARFGTYNPKSPPNRPSSTIQSPSSMGETTVLPLSTPGNQQITTIAPEVPEQSPASPDPLEKTTLNNRSKNPF